MGVTMITVFKSKIHRATVTDANLHYEGSVTICKKLMKQSGILPYEQVHVWDITNGARLITYAIESDSDDGAICINGAGAHLMHKGDLVIIAAFHMLSEKEARGYNPRVVLVDNKNKMING